MSRLKTFLIYALIVIGFYFFANLLIFLAVKGSYEPISGEILTQSPNIEVKEAKATYINGYVDGVIKNDTNSNIENKYIKVDIYTERDVNLGTKYIKIDNLGINETQDFHMGYRFTDSNRYEISFVEEASNATDEQFISEDLTPYLLLSGLLVLCFI